jgi:cell division protein FtsL
MIRTISPIRNRHLVRELDRGRVKELLLVALLVVTLLLPLLGYVWNHMEYIRVGYEVEALKKDRVAQVELRERLRIEKSSLESLARVEGLAAKTLGLVPAEGSEVRVTEAPAPRLAMNHGRAAAPGELAATSSRAVR